MIDKKLPLAVLNGIMIVIQCIVSIWFSYYVHQSGLLPDHYVLFLLSALMSSSVLLLILLLKNKKWILYLAGTFISLAVIIILGYGYYYINLIEKSIETISDLPVEEVDIMVVAVRNDDPAENLEDTEDYLYAVPDTGDVAKIDKTIAFLVKCFDKDIEIKGYETPMEEAEALLSGESDAIIYNEAYTGALNEGIKDYSSKIKILYRFNIKSNFAKTETEKQEQNKTGVETPFTVYISGIDVEGAITTTSRSDVNIIMTVNPDTHIILLTTTPRDYYVNIPGVSGEEKDKLTHAGIYGISASTATLEELYSITIDYYVRVNFSSLITIVDALGGVDVYSEYAFHVGDFSYDVGINHLNGIEALAFSRERYAFATGDNQRGKNQQAVLTAIIDKVTSAAALSHAEELLSVASGCAQTSISTEEIKSLVRKQLKENIKWTVMSQAATGKGDSQPTYSMGRTKLYVMWPDKDVVRELTTNIERVLDGETVQIDTE